jgi:non-specific serine/threonine protein kinase
LWRAQAQSWDFALDERNSLLVARICAGLEGIPLAIELAAARVRSVPMKDIAQRLAQSIKLLTSEREDVPLRQQSLQRALDWSYNLLSLPGQTLLYSVAVFAGGWTLEAAEQVCAGEVVAPGDVLDLLSALVNKSLVLLEDIDGSQRYRLLEPVRQYGWHRLETSGDAARVRDRHLE